MQATAIDLRDGSLVGGSVSEAATHNQTFESADTEDGCKWSRHRVFVGTSALIYLVSLAMTTYSCWTMSGGMTMPGGWNMSMAWMRMPGQTWASAAGSFFGMWIVMMASMMLPVLVPALLRYRIAQRTRETIHLNSLRARAAAGYLLVWALLGVAVYPMGVVVAKAAMASAALARSLPIGSGVILIFAGWLQISKWKAQQLCRCRTVSGGGTQTLDLRNPWKLGVRLGMDCALCCSGLMAFLIVTDVMNLGSMAVVTVAITVERLHTYPRRAARVMGLGIIAAAIYLIAESI